MEETKKKPPEVPVNDEVEFKPLPMEFQRHNWKQTDARTLTCEPCPVFPNTRAHGHHIPMGQQLVGESGTWRLEKVEMRSAK